MVEVEIVIVDRDLPDQMFVVRRRVSDVEGAAFAKWLARPDLGKFLVIVPGDTVDERFINVADEHELGVVIARQFELYKQAAQAQDGDWSFAIKAGVSQQTRANIDSLVKELRERTPEAGTPAA
jgi:hypothetical protein